MIRDMIRLARSVGQSNEAKRRSKLRNALALTVHDTIKAALGKTAPAVTASTASGPAVTIAWTTDGDARRVA